MGFGVCGDVDGAGRGPLRPQLDRPADLPQFGEAHAHGQGQGLLAVVADALRRGHEVRPCVAVLQHFAGILLYGWNDEEVTWMQ